MENAKKDMPKEMVDAITDILKGFLYRINRNRQNMIVNGELKGSIACYRFDIKKNDKVYVRAVLSITSYQQQFTSDNSKDKVNNVRENMDDFVISDFEKRIRIELCLLYLAFLQGAQQNNP